jgi:alkylation response protein AidB-like acyl-CoA dehydrogenase
MAAEAPHGAEAAAHGGEHAAGAFPPFDVSLFPHQLIWFAIAFVALYILMSRVALPSVASVVDARAAKVQGDLDLAAETSAAAETARADAERATATARAGARKIVDDMRAEMAASLEPCRALVWYAGHALDHLPEEASVMACHAKAHLSEVGTFVARTATEVHGGMGFTDLVGLHYWFKRIGFNRQVLGGPQAVRAEAAALQGLVA